MLASDIKVTDALHLLEGKPFQFLRTIIISKICMHAAVLIISRFSYGSKIRYDHRSLIFLLGCPQILPTFSHTGINTGNVPRDKAVKIIESSHYCTYNYTEASVTGEERPVHVTQLWQSSLSPSHQRKD